MDLGPGQMGKWLIIMGLMLCGIGVLVVVLGRFGLFRLPGDLAWGGKNWHVFVPLTSCLLLSAVLTLLMWITSRFLK
jgi:hypothetical protein